MNIQRLLKLKSLNGDDENLSTKQICLVRFILNLKITQDPISLTHNYHDGKIVFFNRLNINGTEMFVYNDYVYNYFKLKYNSMCSSDVDDLIKFIIVDYLNIKTIKLFHRDNVKWDEPN